MSNPQEHCGVNLSVAFTADVCIMEGRVFHYSIRMAEAPNSTVNLFVTGEYLQTIVTAQFTMDDWAEPHFITVLFNENIDITGNYWMLLRHTFVVESDEKLTTRPSWSHARYPLQREEFNVTSTAQNVTAWVPGRLYSPLTQTFRHLEIPILVRDNDEVKVDPVIGEYGRKFRLHTRVKAGAPSWRGPFTVGPSFFKPLFKDDLAEEPDDFWTHGVTGLPGVQTTTNRVFCCTPCFSCLPAVQILPFDSTDISMGSSKESPRI